MKVKSAGKIAAFQLKYIIWYQIDAAVFQVPLSHSIPL